MHRDSETKKIWGSFSDNISLKSAINSEVYLYLLVLIYTDYHTNDYRAKISQEAYWIKKLWFI